MSNQTFHPHDGHDHEHRHGSGHEHSHGAGVSGFFFGLLSPHSHDHSDLAADRTFADNQAGIRTIWLALAALSITSVLQLVIVFASGSVALLADTAHNIGDGLNSIPLLIAFYLARKVATRRYTYGYGRGRRYRWHLHRTLDSHQRRNHLLGVVPTIPRTTAAEQPRLGGGRGHHRLSGQ